jgi:prepilin-type processing-associated H-X9-DG protein
MPRIGIWASIGILISNRYPMASLATRNGAYIPVAFEVQDCTGFPGRNVLFMDGHVEFVKLQRFRELIDPWLAYR